MEHIRFMFYWSVLCTVPKAAVESIQNIYWYLELKVQLLIRVGITKQPNKYQNTVVLHLISRGDSVHLQLFSTSRYERNHIKISVKLDIFNFTQAVVIADSGEDITAGIPFTRMQCFQNKNSQSCLSTWVKKQIPIYLCGCF